MDSAMVPGQTAGKQPGRSVLVVNSGGASVLASRNCGRDGALRRPGTAARCPCPRLVSSLAPPNWTTAHSFDGPLRFNARPPGAVVPVNGHDAGGSAGGGGGAHKSF